MPSVVSGIIKEFFSRNLRLLQDRSYYSFYVDLNGSFHDFVFAPANCGIMA